MRRPELALAVLAISLAARAGPRRSRHDSLTSRMDCSACHTPDGWALSPAAGAADGFDHARTGFPLTGTHRKTACVDCHRPGRTVVRACTGCHQDTHEGRLGGDCADCHSSLAWPDVRAMERHRRTRLPLSGMHALLECTTCHRRTTDRAWSDVPADCFACHEEDYRAATTHPSHLGDPANPAATPFPRDCFLCHRATGWSPAVVVPDLLPRRFALAPRAHDARFPLSFGRHRGAACATCHPYAGAPRIVVCTGCHEHGPARLAAEHRRVGGAPQAGCLGCHPGGAAR